MRSYEQSAAVIIRMSPEQRQQLADRAAEHAMSVNQLVMKALETEATPESTGQASAQLRRKT